MNIKNFSPRLYQETILNTGIKKNTLIILPTGMGKTKTALLIVIKRLQNYPNTKALFLTPTKPLASQIQKEFQENTDIEKDKIILLTGEVKPEERENLAKNAKIIISTPQTISNDLINNRISLKEFSTLVLDEVHRCVKDYDYTWISKEYHKKALYSRIIGLTASPGSDLETITEVCKNAFIEEIELRTENDPDVKPYIQEIKTEQIKVDLPEEYLEVKKFLDDSFKSKIKELQNLNIISNIKPTKKEILSTISNLQGRLAKGERNFTILRAVSLLAESLKVSHALELIETQGIEITHTYLKKIIDESEKTKVKAIKNLVKDLNFRSAYIKSNSVINNKIKHPKLLKLKELLKNEIKKDSNTKVIIFTQYRETAKIIEEEIKDIENIKPKIFVGQVKKGETGLTQKKQIEIIHQFKEKEINVLVSTSIGEEGLDISKVNTVIFFEPIPSAIRKIQRAGRTARDEKGKVILLITKNTRDEAYHWVSYHKEKNMYKILAKLKQNIQLKKQPTLKEFTKNENLLIYADSRENNSNVIKELVDLGVNIKTKQLEIGDYILSPDVCIEKKTINDFLQSIIDKRLLQQLRNMAENYSKPLLILEGEEDIYSLRKIHSNAIKGMLSAITISYRIPILQTKNPKETAELLKIIAKREQESSIKEFNLRFVKKPLTTKEQQEYIVESLPGVGPALSKLLLKKFKTIKDIINANKDSLKEVENFGEKRAEEIEKIVKEIYND